MVLGSLLNPTVVAHFYILATMAISTSGEDFLQHLDESSKHSCYLPVGPNGRHSEKKVFTV